MPRLPILLFASAVLGATVTMATGAIAQDASQPAPAHSMGGQSAGSMELHRVMSDNRNMPMTMSGDVDKDFASMMSMHHQQAIKMADVLLKHGRDAQLKALAQRMKDEQQKEIKELAPFKQ